MVVTQQQPQGVTAPTIRPPDQLMVSLAQVGKNKARLQRSHRMVVERLISTVLLALRELGAFGSKDNATTTGQVWSCVVRSLQEAGAPAAAEQLLHTHVIAALEHLHDEGRINRFEDWPDHDPKCGVFWWVKS